MSSRLTADGSVRKKRTCSPTATRFRSARTLFARRSKMKGSLLDIERRSTETFVVKPAELPVPQSPNPLAVVLDVFWEKRSREKEDQGTRLRPTEKPRPGKAMFNWRPTGDLRPTWRIGLFVWAFLIIGAVGRLRISSISGRLCARGRWRHRTRQNYRRAALSP